MSETNELKPAGRPSGIECIDPENIVIALPRRGGMMVSGGTRTVVGDRDAALEETEPVLAD